MLKFFRNSLAGWKSVFLITILAALVFGLPYLSGTTGTAEETGERIDLPEAKVEKGVAEAIYERLSVREFTDENLKKEEIGHLAWAGEGITVDGVSGPTRSSPSAGATDPLKIHLAVSGVEDLKPGIYEYDTENHELIKKLKGDRGEELAGAALGQQAIADAPAVFLVTADYTRTTSRYGERGITYVHIEAGHAAQNINLMAEQMGLGAVMIGAFEDEAVVEIAGLDEKEPLLIMPVGYEN
ncbi:SagB/ThcOx family dehydrogenase [Halarsenatibacter silvermanii]|uniref:SagB-type dehydrogenase domain-containing protein n=1 Tax=Halarsenatibacter silvermanii TaxID=321763 RepID=A0A1G9ILU5_9FIRM|nr:SagB/ThcOx family dehydrogenase [Halarsenatibacter silvermanii]SDL26100.1 SagB-type dehydrogenase domain-containing protein [Halarsenatibacter silvermanii]